MAFASELRVTFLGRASLGQVAAVAVASVALLLAVAPTSALGETVVNEPGSDEPVAAEPVVTEPVTTEPVVTEPVVTEPVATEPVTGETISTEIEATETDQGQGLPPESTIPEDPMTNEGPGEEAPDTDVTVPPKKTYNGQPEFSPAEILWSSVAAAEDKLAEARADKESAITEARSLRKRQKELRVAQRELNAETIEVIDELDRAGERMQTRAVVGFQRFGSGSSPEAPPDVSDYREVVDSQRRSKMIASALRVDRSDLVRIDQLRASLSGDAVSLLNRTRLVTGFLDDSEDGVTELDAAIDQAAIEYEAFKAGSEVFIHGVVFPIAGSYPTPLIDSFGFPRMPGTPDEHWHEGIDLFADRGTPLVATERGVITKLGVGRLGGLKFWLKGESGSQWYYAHLDSFAPGLANGTVVEAGDLVGYVGNTGNAITTPPHLHMQLHPDGGRPVNPYPLLKVVSDIDLAAIAAGTHTGYDFQNVTVERPEPAPVPTTTITAETTTGS